MKIKDQRKMLFIGLLFFAMFILLFAPPNNPKHQVRDAYNGVVIKKKSLGRDTYEIIIENVKKRDTITLMAWKRDSAIISLGDRVTKNENTDSIFLYKKGCSERSCAITLALFVPFW